MSGNARPVLVMFDKDMGEWLAQCKTCAATGRKSYWPLSTTFFDPRLGAQSCRACHNTKRRLARRAAMDAKAKQRDYYRRNHEHRLAWVHDYRAKHRNEINAKRRAAYARKKEAEHGA
jgi:hypothetical protein